MDVEKWKSAATEMSQRGGYGDATPLKNVFSRVVSLLGEQEVLWSGGDLRFTGREVVTGPMYFFTADLLVLGRLTDFPTMGASGGHYDAGEIQVKVIARSQLVGVDMPQSDNPEAPCNTGGSWAFARSGWPADGCVVLHYKGLDDPLTLRPQTLTDFEDAIPSIVADLART